MLLGKKISPLFLLTIVLITLLAVFFRFYQLSELPPSLYWDEMSLGYDAFSILETGKDHHGNSFPIVAFESFGDWKPSLYFYALVPFIKIFGLTELAVRLPSAFSGIFIVLGVGRLAWLLSSNLNISSRNKRNFQKKLSLTAMAVTAISPWAIQFSRAGWEVNLATALILWGVILFLQFIEVGNREDSRTYDRVRSYLFGSILLLVLSSYTYHAARIVAPLLGLGLTGLWFVQTRSSRKSLGENLAIFLKKNGHYLLIAGVMSVLLLTPILLSFRNVQLNRRFAETSIFTDLSVIETSNARREAEGNSVMSRLFYHRYVLFGLKIKQNFVSHFNLDYLFISGDVNPRHSTQFFGTFYHLEAVFLLLGFYVLLKKRNWVSVLLFFWIVVGILPASITRTSPHALRTLLTMPVFMIIISLGILETIDLFRRYKLVSKLVMLTILTAYVVEVSWFWRHYTLVYPKTYATEWQYGYKEMITELEKLRIQNPDLPVYITRERGRPAMYYWFYTQTDPRLVQQVNSTAKKDQGEFLEFDNIKFVNTASEIPVEPAIVAISTQDFDNKKLERFSKASSIESLDGKIVWQILIN